MSMSATGDNSYAPKSPDLSSFYGAESSNTNFPGSGVFGNTHPLQPRSYHHPQAPTQVPVPEEQHTTIFRQAQPHFNHQALYNSNSTTTTSSPITSNHHSYQVPTQQRSPVVGAPYTYTPTHVAQPSSNPYSSAHYPQYQPIQPTGHTPTATQPLSSVYASYNPSYADPALTGYLPTAQDTRQQPTTPQPSQFINQQPIVFDQPNTPDSYGTMPPRKAATQAVKEPEIMASPVRTKFPTARIKRIMQADEEVGKVAQQTPIAVGKALELFMVQLVEKSAEVAKDKHSKRITAPMLKQAIDSTNEWDFLRDIVAKVSEEKEAAKSGGRAKAESESEDEPDAGEVKKKGRGGRKKKAAV